MGRTSGVFTPISPISRFHKSIVDATISGDGKEKSFLGLGVFFFVRYSPACAILHSNRAVGGDLLGVISEQ